MFNTSPQQKKKMGVLGMTLNTVFGGETIILELWGMWSHHSDLEW